MPDTILFRRGGHLMHYVYDAAGVKHAVEYKTGVGDVNVPLNGVTHVSDWNFAHTEREHYAGNLRYTTEGNAITSMKLLTETGYAECNEPNDWFTEDWTYFCNLKDHLGSTFYTINAETGEHVGYTRYYGFGMEDLGTNPYGDVPGTPSKEKYTGQEFQADFGLNLYDYGWRSYDMATGRFTTIDPMCERYYSVSPYVYCGNNPVNRVDPDGRDWYEDKNKNVIWTDSETSKYKYEGTEYKNIGQEYNGLTVKMYEKSEYQSTFGVKPYGVEIELGYKGEKGDYQWVQTIETNSPQDSRIKSPYVDPTPATDDMPYYYDKGDKSFLNKNGYDVTFYDRPNRRAENDYWNAELSLVKKNGTAKSGETTQFHYDPVMTLEYGFHSEGRNNSFKHMLKVVKNPSIFHLNSINQKVDYPSKIKKK